MTIGAGFCVTSNEGGYPHESRRVQRQPEKRRQHLDSINHFFTIGQMIIPGSSYWNLGISRDKGEVAADEEGLRTMRTLGQNMAWLLKKIHA